MLAHLLMRDGVRVTTVPRQDLAGRNVARLQRHGVALICLSYLNPRATQHAQRLARRLRHHFGDRARIMIGLWTAEPSQEWRQELLEATAADLLATSLRHAVRQIQDHLEPEPPEATPSAA
jgi:hypothetical protein